jgi:hypothetical protein
MSTRLDRQIKIKIKARSQSHNLSQAQPPTGDLTIMCATPFEWKFTRDNLALLMKKLAEKDDYPMAT